MAIDQQLMMGIIFIIAGVALALLAYAAFLYRRAPAELEGGVEKTPIADEDSAPEATPGDDVEDAPAVTVEGSTEPTDEDRESGAEPEVEPEAAPEIAENPPEAEGSAEPDEETDDPEAAERSAEAAPVMDESDVEAEPGPTAATVNLRQDPGTGRLVVEVEGRTFSSAQDLRDSDQWKQVAPILRDTVAWLTLADSRQDEQQEPSEPGTPEIALSPALSMVEQINLILERKLNRGEISTRAVRLVEGADGSIRVYIGVNSYSIDEVPDAEVEHLIHEAVAEWESQQ